MAEYIEREKAIDSLLGWAEQLAETYGKNDEYVLCLQAAADGIEQIPAADVRPVVTCGKCKYGKYTGTEWFCDKHSGHADKFGEDASYHEYHSKYWFCADGEERKHE